MINHRLRGLADLHALVTTLVVGVFFWLYAEFIMAYVPVVRLSREVNLLPYFLCVLAGMLLGWRNVSEAGARLPRLAATEAAGLAARQVALMALIIFSMMFATQDRSISRLFLGTYLVGSGLLLGWLHHRAPAWLARIVYQGTKRVPTAFVGRESAFSAMQTWVARKEQLGIDPVGLVTYGPGIDSRPPSAQTLGDIAALPRLVQERKIGQVILLEAPADPAIARQILDICQEHGCRLLVRHDAEERFGHPLTAVEEEGHLFLTLRAEPLEEPLNRLCKRAYDIAVSLPVVVFILPPLCAVVGLLQRLQAPGPLFHIRSRSGERRGSFPMLKFRSMRVSPPDEGAEALQARREDGRIYPFGRFLRRHSLDEFPQFWNVLKGEMSLVGPRPVMPRLDEEFERQVRAYRSKHWIKPGITGLAQSGGFRGEIQTREQLQERIRLDLYYIAHWSIWLDIQITMKTLWQVFCPPKSAY